MENGLNGSLEVSLWVHILSFRRKRKSLHKHLVSSLTTFPSSYVRAVLLAGVAPLFGLVVSLFEYLPRETARTRVRTYAPLVVYFTSCTLPNCLARTGWCWCPVGDAVLVCPELVFAGSYPAWTENISRPRLHLPLP